MVNISAASSVVISSFAHAASSLHAQARPRAVDGAPAELPVKVSPSSAAPEPLKAQATDRSSTSKEDPQSAEALGERLSAVREQQRMRLEQQEIAELSARDREVRAHEQAHAAIGGQFAGAPRYQFQRGPDGVSYAVGGEVSIDTSEAATPQETIRKMQIVRRSALAPAEPSPQDRQVAAQALLKEAQAQAELFAEKRDDAEEPSAEAEDGADNGAVAKQATGKKESEQHAASDPRSVISGTPSFSSQLYRVIESVQFSSPRSGQRVDARA